MAARRRPVAASSRSQPARSPAPRSVSPSLSIVATAADKAPLPPPTASGLDALAQTHRSRRRQLRRSRATPPSSVRRVEAAVVGVTVDRASRRVDDQHRGDMLTGCSRCGWMHRWIDAVVDDVRLRLGRRRSRPRRTGECPAGCDTGPEDKRNRDRHELSCQHGVSVWNVRTGRNG
jgi:hypothetical protein